MNRRRFLVTVPSLIGVSGCTSDERTQAEEGTSNTDWDLSVYVDQNFSGNVTLEVDCRDEDFSVGSGAYTSIEGEESCPYSLVITGEEAYNATMSGGARTELEVTKDGEVESKVAVH